ncbi:hypothetical protein [Gordonia caeni]|uniref:GrpE protein n=1 Tax=Gordonia caeni TaxID=1007097 RepID=A0ABP7NSQ0_9ACTN
MNWGLLIAAAAAIAEVALVAGYLLRGAVDPVGHRTSGGIRGPEASPAATERADDLIMALTGAYDTSTEDSVRSYVRQELERAGVTRVAPDPGAPFDPQRFRCVATVPATRSSGRLGTVMRTERPGWTRVRDGRPLRAADVTVWSAAE